MNDVVTVMKAADSAARKHAKQRRKGKAPPSWLVPSEKTTIFLGIVQLLSSRPAKPRAIEDTANKVRLSFPGRDR
jgi:hypothetical protein